MSSVVIKLKKDMLDVTAFADTVSSRGGSFAQALATRLCPLFGKSSGVSVWGYNPQDGRIFAETQLSCATIRKKYGALISEIHPHR